MLVTFHLPKDLVHLSGFLKPFCSLERAVSTENILISEHSCSLTDRLGEKALKKGEGQEGVYPTRDRNMGEAARAAA